MKSHKSDTTSDREPLRGRRKFSDSVTCALSADKERVRRILRGDLEPFSELVRLHSPRMLSLAEGIVRSRSAAEDIVQEAFIKAFEKLATWRGDSSLSTWLYRIVYTTAVSSLRGTKFFLEPPPGLTMDEEDGDWELTEANIAKMRRALDELPPLDRTLVTLFYMEDKPVREVAAICGLGEANVKTRLHRIRGRLRMLMDNG
jgi:RNA polymerase sigma-70 factor (ECF subfamily)